MLEDIQAWIAQTVNSSDVVLFMKGTKNHPACGFSKTVVDILNHLKVDFVDINVLDSDQVRDGIKKYSDWPTIPQLYIRGEFIGGCDIVRELYMQNQLAQMLKI